MSDARTTFAPSSTADPSFRVALALTLIAAATIVAAWGFEWAGYPPCELCLTERIPYYAGVPLGALVGWLAWRGWSRLLPIGFAALGAIFAAGAALAMYHAGVEWHLWAGPASCTGSVAAPAKVEDFLRQLQTTNVVRCDAPALHVFGLSLAAWDAVVCLLLTALALRGWTRTRR